MAKERRLQKKEEAAEGDCGRWMQREALSAPGRQKHVTPPPKKNNNLLINTKSCFPDKTWTVTCCAEEGEFCQNLVLLPTRFEFCSRPRL